MKNHRARPPEKVTVVQLLASPSLGGPERQVLGIAQHLPPRYRTVFLTFSERGLCRDFVDEASRLGFEVHVLRANTPNLLRATREIHSHLRRLPRPVLCSNGYKSNLLGWVAARAAAVPIVSISHGWTGANWRARLYESLDRRALRAMDRVVCVSDAQAGKVLGAGTPQTKVTVVPNAIDPSAFVSRRRRPAAAREIRRRFPPHCRYLVGAAGRLSREKGFDVFIDAAARVLAKRRDVGFAVFGDGPERAFLEKRLAAHALGRRFQFLGHRADLAACFSALDLLVIPSFTEGLPVVILEAAAAGLPIVGTTVGGIPEVVIDDKTGFLVPPGDPVALAEKILCALADPARLRAMGIRAQVRVRRHFHVREQAGRYHRIFRQLHETAQATER